MCLSVSRVAHPSSVAISPSPSVERCEVLCSTVARYWASAVEGKMKHRERDATKNSDESQVQQLGDEVS